MFGCRIGWLPTIQQKLQYLKHPCLRHPALETDLPLLSQPRFTHLICDCDGVLVDTESVALDVLSTELQPLMPDTAARVAWLKARLGAMLEPLLGEFFDTVGVAVRGPARFAAIRHAVEAACDERSRATPGVVDALTRIALPKAVASNSTQPRVRAALRRAGLVEVFGEQVYSADLVARPKPSPDVYLAAARGLGAEPGSCLVVEDSVTGVTAATAAGMYVLGFVGGDHSADDHPNRLMRAGAQCVFDHMDQLPALVQSLLAVPQVPA